MNTLRKGLAALAVSTCMFVAAVSAFAQGPGDLIVPVRKELTFFFLPKVNHPWYDVVAEGGQFAVEEFTKQGI